MDSFQKIQGKTTKCDFGSLFVTILQNPRSFFLIVFFFFCFSCNNYIPPSIPPTIVINKEDCKQTYKLSDIVQEYQLIPLETSDSCLIGSVGKIIFDTTSFYLKDETSKLIYHFDMTGKLHNTIGRRGRGPFEYLHLDDYCITKNKNILILDGSSKKMITYTSCGRPIALQELPFFADSFEILNDSILIFNGAAFEDQIILWDYRNKKRINSHLKYDPHYNCRPLKPFTKCNNEILWQREFEQMLYRVTEQELIPARYIDFQEFAYNGKLEKTPQGIYFLQPDIAHMNRYYENDKYIHFIFECEALDDMPFLVYYFKKSGKKIILNNNHYKDDLTFYHITPPAINAFTTAGDPVSVLYTSFWLKNLENTSRKSTIEAFEKLKERTANISETDNPVLVIYKLKDI